MPEPAERAGEPETAARVGLAEPARTASSSPSASRSSAYSRIVSSIPKRSPVPLDEALGDERGERVQLGAADLLGRLEREAAGEGAEPREELFLAVVEEVVAPGERVAQRLLPRGKVACAAGQKLQALAEPLQHRFGREQRDPRRRQLERERQPVEAYATAGAFSVVTSKLGCTACARSAKSATASYR